MNPNRARRDTGRGVQLGCYIAGFGRADPSDDGRCLTQPGFCFGRTSRSLACRVRPANARSGHETKVSGSRLLSVNHCSNSATVPTTAMAQSDIRTLRIGPPRSARWNLMPVVAVVCEPGWAFDPTRTSGPRARALRLAPLIGLLRPIVAWPRTPVHILGPVPGDRANRPAVRFTICAVRSWCQADGLSCMRTGVGNG